MDDYIGFRGERKETLDDIIYIKYKAILIFFTIFLVFCS